MNGNVAEWVSDCRSLNYEPYFRACTTSVDRNRRGFRGGSWQGGAKEARSAFRAFARHNARMGNVGFRLAQEMGEGTAPGR